MNHISLNSNRDNGKYALEYDLKNTMESIKEIPIKLNEYLHRIKEKSQYLVNEMFHHSMIEFMYQYIVDDMFIKVNNILSFLRKYNLINEYHNFLEIQRMMKVIIKDDLYENNEDELKFLNNVLNNFMTLIDFIFKNYDLENFDNENSLYLKEYEKFEEEFMNNQYFFYTKIAKFNDEYKDVIGDLYQLMN
ncbi:MAG: hypothetical protein LBM96_00405 [Methanobrevibacter sp.]|jgi:hypothetical protein|nr:hypothetical protein [Candidatus Methanoflexus mossambicus]